MTTTKKIIGGEMNLDKKLKMLGMGGSWFCEESKTSYDSYEELSVECHGVYKYLGSQYAEIMDPEKYAFFNPATHKGYLVFGGLWRRNQQWYDTMEECEINETPGKCLKWEPPDSYIAILKHEGNKEKLEKIGKYYGIRTTYDTMEECEENEGKGNCITTGPDEYANAFAVMEARESRKSKAAKTRKRDEAGHFI